MRVSHLCVKYVVCALTTHISKRCTVPPPYFILLPMNQLQSSNFRLFIHLLVYSHFCCCYYYFITSWVLPVLNNRHSHFSRSPHCQKTFRNSTLQSLMPVTSLCMKKACLLFANHNDRSDTSPSPAYFILVRNKNQRKCHNFHFFTSLPTHVFRFVIIIAEYTVYSCTQQASPFSPSPHCQSSNNTSFSRLIQQHCRNHA